MARKPADQSVNREDIIMAAADVLHRNGYEATTMKDIAAEVNLTAASLYHHFRNKDMLVLAVLEEGIGRAIELMTPIVNSAQSPAEKLREMVRVHVTGVAEHTSVGAAMVFEIRSLLTTKDTPRNVANFDDEAHNEFLSRRAHFFAQRDEFEGLFEQVVQTGIDTGDFADLDTGIFVKTMLGAQNWVPVWFRPGGRLSGEDIATRIAETFLRALRK